MKKIIPFLSLLYILILSGCASTYVPPRVNLNTLETFYVQTSPEDEHQVDQAISEQLKLMGFESSYGPADATPAEIDAIVNYQDQWAWDVKEYLLELKIQVYRASDGVMIGNGRVYRTSLQRRTVSKVAREVLEDMFYEEEEEQSY